MPRAPRPSPVPIGFQRFHKRRFFNYQLNRLHGLGFVRADELHEAATRIDTVDDYVCEFDALSALAEAEGRVDNAAFYARAAEMFSVHGSLDKRHRYERFMALFDRAFANESISRHEIPYGGGFLPARHLPATAERHGTVVFFGGFDSIVEEFVSVWSALSQAGFDVIAFDGPGQGGARTQHALVFEHDWEKPIGSVLDHFQLENVALVGMSMGGYWAIRAAAYEPRVKAVASWPPVYDWLERIPRVARPLVGPLLRRRRYMNWNVRLRTRLSPTLRHIVNQAMYITGGDEPMDAVTWFLGMNAEHLSSHRVTQHVALVGGEHDAFQPVKLLHRQADALTNAASVTVRVFTAAEHADQHCQMGNLPLATRWVTQWLRWIADEEHGR